MFALLPQAAQAQARADFNEGMKKAVSSTLPGFALREHSAMASDSVLDGGQRVRVRTATFAAGGRVLMVARAVGAEREVTPRYAPTGTIVKTMAVRRPAAGLRQAALSSTADKWGPGLTVLAWSERRGVNYQLVVAGGATQRELVKLAGALPRDDSKPTAKERATIANARPPAPTQIDQQVKQPQAPNKGEVAVLGTGNKIVDGAGATTDDLGDEATLCNGCAYSNGNYAGMWQHILRADGNMSPAQIDCQFGPTTATATAAWQRARGLSADGVVGPGTRGVADGRLSLIGGTSVYYMGARAAVPFSRAGGTGHYYILYSDGTGPRVNYTRTGGDPPYC